MGQRRRISRPMPLDSPAFGAKQFKLLIVVCDTLIPRGDEIFFTYAGAQFIGG